LKFFIVFTLLLSKGIFAQIAPKMQYQLPSILSECSGMAYIDPYFIALNDGGNAAHIHVINKTGNLVNTIEVNNATNIDWEAICINNQGDLYIGDIGNNDNIRQDLKIYVIKNFKDSLQNSSVQVSYKIDFSYAAQNVFPPANDKKHFDAEAMIMIKDSLFIFSKNRSNPYNGYTYVYGLKDTVIMQNATIIDSFFAGNGPKELSWVTDAFFDQKDLYLLSHSYVWQCKDYLIRGFANSEKLILDTYTQKEACVFVPPNFWVADEKNSLVGGGNLYAYPIISNNNSITFFERNKDYLLSQNQLEIINESMHYITIFDLQGKQLLAISLTQNRKIDLSPFANQVILIYFNNVISSVAEKVFINPK